MKQLTIVLAATLIAAVIPSTATAAGPLYVTGAVLNASTSVDLEADFQRLIDEDDDGTSFGVGFHIGEHLAIEGVYHDFGSVSDLGICGDPEVLCTALTAPGALVAPTVIDSTAISVSVLPHWPVTKHFSIYGRIGVASWEGDVTEAFSSNVLDSISDEELIFGAGVRVNVLGPFGAFAEFSRVADTFETISLGATLGF